MKKIVGKISKEEAEEIISLSSILQTYMTLLQIDDFRLDHAKVEHDLNTAQDRLNRYWDHIFLKYGYSFILDQKIMIDHENGTLYYNTDN